MPDESQSAPVEEVKQPTKKKVAKTKAPVPATKEVKVSVDQPIKVVCPVTGKTVHIRVDPLGCMKVSVCASDKALQPYRVVSL